jgi:hypothetical protein
MYANELILEGYKACRSILDVPLFASVPEDKLVWVEDKYGCYSVKSGYNLIMRDILWSDR